MSKTKAALFYNYPSAIEGEVFGKAGANASAC